MLRMVFCDVDGTLLKKTETTISNDTLHVLRRLLDRGITVVIATGRPYGQLKPLFGSLFYRLVFLCMDGALVMHKNCVLYKKPMMKCKTKELIALYGGAAIYGREHIYCIGDTPVAGKRVHIPEEIPEDYLKVELPTGSVSGLHASFRIAYQNERTTELVAAGADKGAAARALMQKFGVSPDQAIAFGDGENDIPLLCAVGYPYRMKDSLCVGFGDLPTADSVESVLRGQFGI
ncbi:MAG: HAD-IIB family hydrolase [Clostridia bacterium]|nr:HAD-IIB family hydrolase [Clostridia bacterium]